MSGQGESVALTLLLPVIRDWTRSRVIAAIAASDITRDRCILVLDAPGCGAWWPDLMALGFDVDIYATGKPYPPEGRIARRGRARENLKYMQTLVPDGRLLCLEDDIIVPPDIYTRLSAVGPNATGVQIARHEYRVPVIYGRNEMGVGVQSIDGCGYGCLLTTGEAFRAPALGDGPGPVDYEHTAQIRPLVVDWGCVCGHITPEEVIYP